MLTPSDILFSRRLFMTRGVQLLSVAGTLPLFLDHSARCMAADFAANPAGAGRPDDHVLVVVQLAGGNDGLNTVVPLGNDDYYKARPKLGVPAGRALKLSDEWGLNPAATGFKKMFDAGDLAIVHAVGYPNANRSHFRATDIWTTAEPDKRGTDGWLGRYCDASCAGEDPGHRASEGTEGASSPGFGGKVDAGISRATANKQPDPATAIALDVEPPPALLGAKYIPLTFRPNGGDGGKHRPGMQNPLMADPGPKLNHGPDDAGEAMASQSASAKAREFIQRTALNARVYSDRIRNISSTIENKANYPVTPLARDLKLIAQLIASDLPTRVYYVKMSGFDTHANQAQNHPRLLGELTDGIAAFMDDLQQLGHHHRTTLMTFSEFGRRVHENGSGTDHGEAAPLFLAGGAITPGLHGTFPGLSPAKLRRGDVPFTTDFRRIYAELLHGWMGADDAKILGGQFEPIGLLKKA